MAIREANKARGINLPALDHESHFYSLSTDDMKENEVTGGVVEIGFCTSSCCGIESLGPLCSIRSFSKLLVWGIAVNKLRGLRGSTLALLVAVWDGKVSAVGMAGDLPIRPRQFRGAPSSPQLQPVPELPHLILQFKFKVAPPVPRLLYRLIETRGAHLVTFSFPAGC